MEGLQICWNLTLFVLTKYYMERESMLVGLLKDTAYYKGKFQIYVSQLYWQHGSTEVKDPGAFQGH